MTTENRNDVFQEQLKEAFSIPAPDSLQPDQIESFLDEKKKEGKGKKLDLTRLLPFAAGFVIVLGCVIAIQSGAFRFNTAKDEDMPSIEGGENMFDLGGGDTMQESTAGIGGYDGGEDHREEEAENGAMDMEMPFVETSRGGVRFVARGGEISAYDAEGVTLASATFGNTTDIVSHIAFFEDCVAVVYTAESGDSAASVFIFDAGQFVFLREVEIDGAIRRVSGDDISLTIGYDSANGEEMEMALRIENGTLVVADEEATD